MENENEVDMFTEVDYEPESDNEEEQVAREAGAEAKGKNSQAAARGSNKFILTGIPKSASRKVGVWG
jgi:hypothetical protein